MKIVNKKILLVFGLVFVELRCVWGTGKSVNNKKEKNFTCTTTESFLRNYQKITIRLSNDSLSYIDYDYDYDYDFHNQLQLDFD